jgi:hypothetical protein
MGVCSRGACWARCPRLNADFIVPYVSAKHAIDFCAIVVTRMVRKPFEHVRVDVNNAAQRMTPILGRCFRNIPKINLIVRQISELGELIAFSRTQIRAGSCHGEEAKPTKQSRGKRCIL